MVYNNYKIQKKISFWSNIHRFIVNQRKKYKFGHKLYKNYTFYINKTYVVVFVLKRWTNWYKNH